VGLRPPDPSRPVLLTGARGFVGRHLRVALEAAGRHVRCASRRPELGRSRPGREWVRADVGDPSSLAAALDGCESAFYLVHDMGAGPGYAEREARQAALFRDAAARAGLRRVVYLGGTRPAGRPSRHLESRLETGRILRSGAVSTVELRAGMVVGAGSESWQIVRDLSSRLPVMVLPRWLRNHSQPIAVDDVVRGLLAALDLRLADSACLDLPGPETVSHRELLRRVSLRRGREAWMVDVPVLTPRLSSHWIRLVTRANFAIARELVDGLTSDLLAGPDTLWARIGSAPRLDLDRAIDEALADEAGDRDPDSEGIPARAARRLAALGTEHGRQAA
jgi:uncharacterized protein YbjT (DUF2867 family)